jgi:hypothetical protein
MSDAVQRQNEMQQHGDIVAHASEIALEQINQAITDTLELRRDHHMYSELTGFTRDELELWGDVPAVRYTHPMGSTNG